MAKITWKIQAIKGEIHRKSGEQVPILCRPPHKRKKEVGRGNSKTVLANYKQATGATFTTGKVENRFIPGSHSWQYTVSP